MKILKIPALLITLFGLATLINCKDDPDNTQPKCRLDRPLDPTIYNCGDYYIFKFPQTIDLRFSIYGVSIEDESSLYTVFPADELDFSRSNGRVRYDNGDTYVSCDIEVKFKDCPTVGILSLTDPIAAGDDFVVTVEDSDLADEGDFDLTVTTDLGESEIITLSETSTVGVFTGTLSTVLSATKGEDNDGTLNIENGVVISVSYDDELGPNASNPGAITEEVTASGDFAGSEGIVYNDVTYFPEYGSYTDFSDIDGTVYFTIINEETGSEFQVDIALNSTDTFESETYTVGGATYSVVAADSFVKVGSELGDGDVVTSGSVVLTIDEAGYTLEMNLTTSVSTLVGTYTIPIEE